MAALILYKLLPRKVNGFWTVTLNSNENSVQFRSQTKANALDWIDDNQPKQPQNAPQAA
jgi:hypothetical protein